MPLTRTHPETKWQTKWQALSRHAHAARAHTRRAPGGGTAGDTPRVLPRGVRATVPLVGSQWVAPRDKVASPGPLRCDSPRTNSHFSALSDCSGYTSSSNMLPAPQRRRRITRVLARLRLVLLLRPLFPSSSFSI